MCYCALTCMFFAGCGRTWRKEGGLAVARCLRFAIYEGEFQEGAVGRLKGFAEPR